MHQFVEHTAAGVGHSPGQQVVEGAAEAVNVGPAVGLVGVVSLFRGDIVGRAHDHPGVGQVRYGGTAVRQDGGGLHDAAQPGQAEIEDLDLSVGRPHQVVRLDVAMHHALLVGVLQPSAACRA